MKRFKKPQVRTWVALADPGRKASGHNGTFCKGVAQVLRGIDQRGALMAATKESGMAYSKGWLLLKHAEESLGVRLIVTDGARGSSLTDEGRTLLETYEQLQQECAEFAERRFGELLEEKRVAARKDAGKDDVEKERAEADVHSDGSASDAKSAEPAPDAASDRLTPDAAGGGGVKRSDRCCITEQALRRASRLYGHREHHAYRARRQGLRAGGLQRRR
ncbi:MAG: hypothetical protein LBP28_07350 [Coriobacteriales bacterium]|jgi:molybdate transport system regulatory protein|nr:hypothetical protein [Coriobacteriales bacterium]